MQLTDFAKTILLMEKSNIKMNLSNQEPKNDRLYAYFILFKLLITSDKNECYNLGYLIRK